MSNKNELLKFAGGDDPNVTPFSQWENLPAVKTGFKSGIAKSAELNRVFAQGALASNVLGAFVVENAHEDATLNSDLYAGFKKGLRNFVAGNVGVGSIQPKHLTPTFDVSSLTFSVKQATSNARGRSVYATGELVFDTDTKKLYAGDGATAGGVEVGSDLKDALTATNLNAYARDIANWKVKAGNGTTVPTVSFVGGSTFALKNEGETLDISESNVAIVKFGADNVAVRADLSMENHRVKGLANPQSATDATNKAYVDTEIARAISGVEPEEGIVTDSNFGSKDRYLQNLTVSGALKQGGFSVSGNASQWSVSHGSSTMLSTSNTAISANYHKIVSVGTPTQSYDAANKSYVDGKCSGFASESWVTNKGYATEAYVRTKANDAERNAKTYTDSKCSGFATESYVNGRGFATESYARAKANDAETNSRRYTDSKFNSIQAIPTGMVAFFHASSAPSGWLLCNGGEVSQSSYPALYRAIGSTYGSASSGKFRLPNLLDKFIQGASSSIGSSVPAGLPDLNGALAKHYHGIKEMRDANDTTSGGVSMIYQKQGQKYGAPAGARFTDGYGGWDKRDSFYGGERTLQQITAYAKMEGVSATQRVQPPSLKLLPCIKA